MKKLFEIGNVVRFDYNGKNRWVRIEKIQKTSGNMFFDPMADVITGWDYEADHPVGGYRSFSVRKIKNAVLVR